MGIGPICKNVTVATSGTRVQLFSTATYAAALYVEGLDLNSGSLYFGNSTVSSANYMKKIGAGIGFTVNAQFKSSPGTDGGMLDLSKFWVDATANSQILLVTYLLHMGSS